MVFCIVAMVVFGVLGIFSAKYRAYAREAFRCFARLTTLRPCDTQFDEQMRAKITARLMERSPSVARFLYAHFGAISVVFAVAMLLSLAYTGYSVYNLTVHGTCDPANPDQCVLNPQNPNAVLCPFESLRPAEGTLKVGGFFGIESANITKQDGKPLVYFFGTTWCPHCRWERPRFVNATSNFGTWLGLKEGDLSSARFESDYIIIRAYEVDRQQMPLADMKALQHYSPAGNIPLIILGGKYFRIGSGEANGADEERILVAYLCKMTDAPIDACNEPSVKSIIAQI